MLVQLVLALECFVADILAAWVWATMLARLMDEHVALELIWSIENGTGGHADAALELLALLFARWYGGRGGACDEVVVKN